MAIKSIRKILSFVLSFNLLFQSLVPFLVSPVYADDSSTSAVVSETTPTPTSEPEVTPTPSEEITPEVTPSTTPEITPTPTEEITPTVSPDPTPLITPEETPTPSVEITPSIEPTPVEEITPAPEESSNDQPQAPPQENNQSNNSSDNSSSSDTQPQNTTPNPEPTPTVPESVTIVSQLEQATLPQPTLSTDKADYFPTDIAYITGKNFNPSEIYTLHITSLDLPTVSYSVEVTADETGSFTYAYQLDGHYRPDYSLEISDTANNSIAELTFTDTTWWTICHHNNGANQYSRIRVSSKSEGGHFDASGNPLHSGDLLLTGDVSCPSLGSITVKKDANGEDKNFSFHIVGMDLNQDFTLNDKSSSTDDKLFINLPLGQYVVSEDAAAEWTLTNISCSSEDISLSERKVTITITNNEDQTCTFNNDKLPDLSVTKTNDLTGNIGYINEQFNWKIRIDNTGFSDAIFNENEIIFSDILPNTNVNYGAITINTHDVAGSNEIICSINSYTLSCKVKNRKTVIIKKDGYIEINIPTTFSENSTYSNPRLENGCVVDPNTDVTEADEQNNYCSNTVTIINPTGSLTIYKHVINDNGGLKEANDFSLSVTGNTPSQSSVVGNENGSEITLKAGDYSVTEPNHPGYDVEYSSGCSGTIVAGNEYECTVTNKDIAPTITLIKEVVNDDGGKAGVNDFGLSIGGTSVSSGETLMVDSNKQYVLNEAGLSGYQFISMSGEGCPENLGDTVTLNEGENITCTIKNDDIAGHLVVKKTIENNSKNVSLDDFSFTINVDNQNKTVSADSQTGLADFGSLPSGTYTITESGPSGYFISSAVNCSKTAYNTASVSISNDSEVTCELKNTGIPYYTGENSCGEGYVEKKIASYEIDSQDADGQQISEVVSGTPYLYKVSGTFIPTSAPGYVSDAAHTTINGSWSNLYGINGTNPDFAAHALLGNLGLGVGVIDWGIFNPAHTYQRVLTSSTNSPQFVIGDRFSNWFGTPYDNQGGQNDNSGSLNLDVYQCLQEEAQLSVTKNSDKSSYFPGDTVTYTFDYSVSGNTNITNAKLTEVIPSGMEFSTSGNTGWVKSGSTLTYNLGTLSSTATGTVSLKLKISSSFANTSIDNTVTFSGNKEISEEALSTTADKTITVKLGSIKVCKVILDPTGKIVSGATNPYSTFSLSWLSSSTTQGAPISTPEQADFSTGLTLDSDIHTSSGNDAQCTTYSNIPFGNYYYGQETISGNGWKTPKYYDSYSSKLSNFNNFAEYSGQLFDTNPGNDGQRNTNSDGHILLTTGNPNRTLVILNQYSPVKIIASKVVCDNESYLPNNTQGTINADTAQNWVNQSEGKCHIEPEWNFQWGKAGSGSFGSFQTDTSSLSSPWTTFTSGTTEINDIIELGGRIETREVFPNSDYVPFSNSGNNSSEFYCTGDTANYDNWEWINNPKYGDTFYCVGFNAFKGGTLSVKKVVVGSEEDKSNFSFQVNEDEAMSFESDGQNDLTVDAGTYSITEPKVEGYKTDYDNCSEVEITNGGSQLCTITNTKLAKLKVFKFQDDNQNGYRDSGEENGEKYLSGWEINLGQVESDTTTKTTEDGHVIFENLIPGDYDLSENQKEGWFQSNIFCPKIDGEVDAMYSKSRRLNIYAGDDLTCYIGNYSNPELSISKFNNAGGDKTPGSSVVFRILVKVSKSLVNNLKVKDLLPKGFVYRSGSYSASINGLPITITEPVYHSPGTWNIGTVQAGDEIELLYTADISSDQHPGLYRDLALAQGTSLADEDILALANDDSKVDTNFVGTSVNIVKDQTNGESYSVEKKEEVTGQVLGASTDLPATGANTLWLAAALVSLLFGLKLIKSK